MGYASKHKAEVLARKAAQPGKTAATAARRVAGLTPATAHKAAVLAAAAVQSQAQAPDPEMEGLGIYDQMLMRLAQDLRDLKEYKSAETKGLKKAELLPAYEAYVNGILEGGKDLAPGTAPADEVFMTVLIWCIDAGDIDRALEMAAYAFKHDLPLPARFERDLASVVTEEIADIAAKSDTVHLTQLEALSEMVAGKDMHDQIRAKLCKVTGAAYEAAEDLTNALAQYTRALELDEKCGVKTAIGRIKKKLTPAQ